MKILAIYRHYWPDATPYARLLRAILEDQVEQGREVSVFTAQPGYNDIEYATQASLENLAGVDIRRIRLLPEKKRWRILRTVNFVYFLLRAVFHVLISRRYDLIIANTHPPVLIGIALRLIGVPYVLHCQDIHPESALIAGQIKQGWLANWLLRSDTKSCASATRLVTLSEEMKLTLKNRPGIDPDKVMVINNFPLDVYQKPEKLPELFTRMERGSFCVLFAGNMGHFQELPRLIEAARLLNNYGNLKFIFMGTGAEKPKLEYLAGDALNKSIFFEPFQAVEVAFACMQKANLGVVSLQKRICKVAYPSKTMTYLAAGCPILAIAETESQLAKDVTLNDFGYVPTTLNPEAIASSIKHAMHEKNTWNAQKRKDLIKRGNDLFGRDRTLVAWRGLFNEMEVELLATRSKKIDPASTSNKLAA